MEEFQRIIETFKDNEVSKYVALDSETKVMISIAVLTTLGTTTEMKEEVITALNENVSADSLSEAAIQCTPYVGYSRVKEALEVLYTVFKEKGINLSLRDQTRTTPANRLEKGLEVQQSIFGADLINKMRESAPEDLKHIQYYLSAYCFGDFYTRGKVDLKIRELLTFCCLATLGGCEPQLRSHIVGNLNVGNDRNTLLLAITWCTPYIGFPRTLNTINCINKIV